MSRLEERDAFIHTMTQEYPTAPTLVVTLQELMRLSRRHRRLQEMACNGVMPENHDAKCEERIRKVCSELPGCVPLFQGDPRGCTVKLKVPSGRTNDLGAIGICVPQ